MATPISYFYITAEQREILRRFAKSHFFSITNALRYLILSGPVSYAPDEDLHYTSVVSTCPYVFGDPSAYRLELIRQRTNIDQILSAFDKYCRRNAVFDFIEEETERYQALPNLIQESLYSIIGVVDSASEFLFTISPHISIDVSNDSFTSVVSARLDSFYVYLLDTKAKIFGETRSGYIRLVLNRLQASKPFAEVIDGDDNALFAITTFDLDEVAQDFNRCGKVLNDAAHYINEWMLPVVSSSSYAVESDMETLLGKLNVALDQYTLYSNKHLSFEVGGAR